jgi:lysozyme
MEVSEMDETNAVEFIKGNEGLRLKPYGDSRGIITIGYGRNLRDNGITQSEADTLFEHDYLTALRTCQSIFGAHYESFTSARRAALLDMAFNLGEHRLRGFRRMIAAVNADDWSNAAIHAMDSQWYRQVGDRSKRVVAMLSTGAWK